MHMSTALALHVESKDKHTNDAVKAVINISEKAYDCMWKKLYDQTRILIAKRMSKYATN